MELHRRLDYGFNGYQVPPTPRAARSARRRSVNTNTRKADEGCAFDLLATLAGEILLEGENTPSSVDMGSQREGSEAVKDSLTKDKQDEDKNVNDLCNNQGICDDRSFIVSELVLEAPGLNEVMKDLPRTPNEACSGPLSAITTSGSSEKVGSAGQLGNTEFKVECGTTGKADIELFGCRVSPACKFEAESKKPMKVEPDDLKLAISSRDDEHNTEGPKAWDRKPSDNSVKSLPKDQLPGGSLPHDRENVNVGIKDDDENSSGCTQPSTGNKAFRPSARIGDRRIRKLLSSKYWKVSPNSKDAESKHVYHNGNSGFKRMRSQRDYPFKKRKLYHCSSPSNSSEEFGNDGICSSQVNGSSKDASAAMFPRVSGTSNSKASEHDFFQCNDSQVKLKIKSFRVPEFFIEIPETATVGNLKKTVMEAVTAILSGGLRVGVLLQGKKVRDDSKTLLQTGISHDNKVDALSFSLEPNLSQASPPLHPEDHAYLLSCDNPKPISRYPPAPIANNTTDIQGTFDALTDSPGAPFNSLVESDHDSAPSPPDMSLEKNAVDTKALVIVPAMNVGALNVVPMRKSKRSEAAQRRIRRPFSVSEVEALVQAVEKLGTGRWRDVKLRAFDNAKHRTYVDLKDKWKTLVHTARISPQQRRGEPVPQELLDRVLTAHAYWTQQQVKPQFKQQPETFRLL